MFSHYLAALGMRQLSCPLDTSPLMIVKAWVQKFSQPPLYPHLKPPSLLPPSRSSLGRVWGWRLIGEEMGLVPALQQRVPLGEGRCRQKQAPAARCWCLQVQELLDFGVLALFRVLVLFWGCGIAVSGRCKQRSDFWQGSRVVPISCRQRRTRCLHDNVGHGRNCKWVQ